MIERRAFLGDRNALIDMLHSENPSIAVRLDGARRLADGFRTETSDRLATMLQALVRRIEIKSEGVEVVISHAALDALIADPTTDPVPVRRTSEGGDDLLALTMPVRLKRAGREMRLVVADDPPGAPDPGLLRVVARAHDIAARLVQDPDLAVHDVARSEGVSSAYVYCLLRLAWLAPDITTAIIDGRRPSGLTAKTLMRSTGQLPVEWAAQRRLLEFPPTVGRQ